MPSTYRRPQRPAMYNTPSIRNGGFGALQVEAINNRPLSIARRHLAASTLRMGQIEPDELSSSEWVRFLVMEERERERWMTQFRQRRRGSDESSSSAELDRETAYDKAEEARQEAQDSRRGLAVGNSAPSGPTPAISIWARQFDDDPRNEQGSVYSARRPRHARHAAGEEEAPPTYSSAVRASEPPPAYVAGPNQERLASPPYSPPSSQ